MQIDKAAYRQRIRERKKMKKLKESGKKVSSGLGFIFLSNKRPGNCSLEVVL